MKVFELIEEYNLFLKENNQEGDEIKYLHVFSDDNKKQRVYNHVDNEKDLLQQFKDEKNLIGLLKE